jgi:glycerol uptake facilitator-like aquaporin
MNPTLLKQCVTEFIGTFALIFVGIGAIHNDAGLLAIGLTVALDILFGGPLTGAVMNSPRTFVPALASNHWKNHAVYWIGPMLGGALAGLVYGRFLIKDTK